MYSNPASNQFLSNSKIETQVGYHRHISLTSQGQSSELVWHKPMIFEDFRGRRGFGFR
jgi:hypothetical protein